jgi:hypothetical protein
MKSKKATEYERIVRETAEQARAEHRSVYAALATSEAVRQAALAYECEMAAASPDMPDMSEGSCLASVVAAG